jgi:hypothetical protein
MHRFRQMTPWTPKEAAMHLDHYLQLQTEMRQARQRRTSPHYAEQELYQIFEASDENNPQDVFLVAVSASGYGQLEEDILLGRKLFRLGRKIYETTDQAQARRISDRQFP